MTTDQDSRRPQFEHEKRYHDLLLAEPDPRKRQFLYREAYAILYRDFFNAESGKTEFGARSFYTEMMRGWGRGAVIVDVGCGLGEATLQFARFARAAIGLEVDTETVRRCRERFRKAGHDNITALPFDGLQIPLADESVDLAYSNNVFEHLHPDDAFGQTREVYRILRPGGRFICITPPRHNGPHDISKFFLPPGSEAQGLHLKEYTLEEIADIFRQIGFRRTTQPWIAPNRLLGYGLIGLYPWLQRSIRLSRWLENSPARRSGFLVGHLCLDMIVVCARKGWGAGRFRD